jgi:hypothetical protein
MQLTTDPFTGNRYTFAAGNPITNIELDGHTQCDAGICPTQRQTQQVTQAAAQYGAGCPSTEPGCPGYYDGLPSYAIAGAIGGGYLVRLTQETLFGSSSSRISRGIAKTMLQAIAGAYQEYLGLMLGLEGER